MIDSKRLKFDEKDTLKDIEAFSTFPVVGDSSEKVYLYLKAQRLLIALYLITNHIKDIEPIKIEVRKSAVIITDIVSKLNRTSEVDRTELIGVLGESVFTTISLLETLMRVGLVSADNGAVIKRELVFLVRFAEGHIFGNENQGFVNQDVFNIPPVRDRFEVKRSAGESFRKNSNKKVVGDQTSFEGGSFDAGHKKSEEGQGGKTLENEGFSIGHIGQSLSEDRISSIVNLLKVRSGLSVKDFSEVIPGVSEKTIQRELAILADKGIVIRAGERRWTRYSLAS